MLSWRYVEQPFRSAELLPRPRDLCRAAAVAAALLLAAAAAIVLGDGLPWRLSPQAAAYARSAGGSGKDEQGVTVEDVRSGKLPTCGAVDGPATCLLWGDSHAMALIPGLEAASRETGFRCLPVTMPATAPVLDFFVRYPAGLNERSADWARAAVDHAKAEGVDVVFLAAHWEWYAPAPTFATRLDATVRELAAAGVHVVIVRDVARFPSSVPLTLCMATRLGTDVTTIGVPIGEHARRNERCDALFSRLEGGGVAVLDLAPAFVDRAGLWRAEYDGVAMYRDSNHLSQAGSLRTRTLFESVLRRFAAGR